MQIFFKEQQLEQALFTLVSQGKKVLFLVDDEETSEHYFSLILKAFSQEGLGEYTVRIRHQKAARTRSIHQEYNPDKDGEKQGGSLIICVYGNGQAWQFERADVVLCGERVKDVSFMTFSMNLSTENS